ncbi:hypothetical protein Q3G72_019065 [Acer saccharum]|nr:hypothetical protein Q3G72_019065 [Acer saccharum]
MTQYHIKGDQGDTIVFAGDGGMVSLPPHLPQIKVSGNNTLESAYFKAILFSKVGVDLSNVLGFPTDYPKPKDILKVLTTVGGFIYRCYDNFDKKGDKISEKGKERSSRNSRQWNNYENCDFREGLFSIFLDNLNPVVDQARLWGIFKQFGLVRDVFLSSRNNSRRSAYAFIRFATLAEATKVARDTDGMHIYGWPIVSKLATSSWRNRRSRSIKGDRTEAGLDSKDLRHEYYGN